MAKRKKKPVNRAKLHSRRRLVYWGDAKQHYSFGAASGMLPESKEPGDPWIETQGTIKRLQQASFRQWMQTFYFIKYHLPKYASIRLYFSGDQFFWVRKAWDSAVLEHSDVYGSKREAEKYLTVVSWNVFEDILNVAEEVLQTVGIPCTKELPTKFKRVEVKEKEEPDGIP